MMSGYYNDAAATRAAMPDGLYVRTGDLGRIDRATGEIHIVGRTKDVIVAAGGVPVCPRDVEDALAAHACVANAAVFGVPHPCGAGEMVVAWVAATAAVPGCDDAALTPDALRAHCEATLPAWQRPERIRVSEVALPCVGEKVDKAALRKREIGDGVSTVFSTPEHAQINTCR